MRGTELRPLPPTRSSVPNDASSRATAVSASATPLSLPPLRDTNEPRRKQTPPSSPTLTPSAHICSCPCGRPWRTRYFLVTRTTPFRAPIPAPLPSSSTRTPTSTRKRSLLPLFSSSLLSRPFFPRFALVPPAGLNEAGLLWVMCRPWCFPWRTTSRSSTCSSKRSTSSIGLSPSFASLSVSDSSPSLLTSS